MRTCSGLSRIQLVPLGMSLVLGPLLLTALHQHVRKPLAEPSRDKPQAESGPIVALTTTKCSNRCLGLYRP